MSILGLLLSVALLPTVLSAPEHVYFDPPPSGSPFLGPQVPLTGPPAVTGTHEFVGFIPVYLIDANADCSDPIDASPHISARYS